MNRAAVDKSSDIEPRGFNWPMFGVVALFVPVLGVVKYFGLVL
ncbi:hypothetical protein [Sphingomonas sp. ID0503]